MLDYRPIGTEKQAEGPVSAEEKMNTKQFTPVTLETKTTPDPILSRREVLQGTLLGMIALLTPITGNAADQAHSQPSLGAGKNRAVVDAGAACVGSGEVCLKHIMDQFAAGDTSLTVCGMRVQEMIAVCRALITLAASDAPQLKPFAKVCIEVCKACETECRKHEQHHPICKETAESCARVSAACEKLIA